MSNGTSINPGLTTSSAQQSGFAHNNGSVSHAPERQKVKVEMTSDAICESIFKAVSSLA